MAGKKIKRSKVPKGSGKAKFNLMGLFKSIKWTKRTRLFVLMGIVVVLLLTFSFQGVGADMMTRSCADVKGQCFEEDYPVSTGDSVKFNLKFIDTKTKKEIADPAVSAKITSSNCYAKGAPGHPKGGCIIESKTENFTGTNFVSLYQMEKRTYLDSVLKETVTVYFPGYKSKTNTNAASSQWRSVVYTTKDSAGKTLSITVKSPFTYTSNKSRASVAMSGLSGKTFSTTAAITKTSSSNKKTTSKSSGNTVASKSQGATSAADEKALAACKPRVKALGEKVMKQYMTHFSQLLGTQYAFREDPTVKSIHDVAMGAKKESDQIDDKEFCLSIEAALNQSTKPLMKAYELYLKIDAKGSDADLKRATDDYTAVKWAFAEAAVSVATLGVGSGAIAITKGAQAAKGAAGVARAINTGSKLAKAGQLIKAGATKIIPALGRTAAERAAITAAEKVAAEAAKAAMKQAGTAVTKKVAQKAAAKLAQEAYLREIEKQLGKTAVKAAEKQAASYAAKQAGTATSSALKAVAGKTGGALKSAAGKSTNAVKAGASKAITALGQAAAKNAAKSAASSVAKSAVKESARKAAASGLSAAGKKAFIEKVALPKARDAAVQAATKSLKGVQPNAAMLAEIDKTVAKEIAAAIKALRIK